MDPIANKITEHVSQQSLGQGAGAAPTGKVDTTDQMHFEQMLNGGQEGAQGTQGVQDPNQAANNANQIDQTPGASKPTFGDAILDGIEKLKTNHDVRADRIEQSLLESNGEMSMEQMMKLQFEVMQMGIEQDITTKMADKTSSGIQTMFRNQG